MNKFYKILDWDSNFFGFNVCKININDIANLNNVLADLEIKNFKLAYLNLDKALHQTELDQIKNSIVLVDRKTTFVKKVEQRPNINENIETYKEHSPEKKLFELAAQSGIYSRFNRDKCIEENKFKDLYKQWIINSVNKEIAEEVLVYKSNQQILGLVTLGKKDDRADIGIISVDNQSRGKGIGKSLMHSAENWFAQNNYQTIQVITQEDNVAACNLYKRCGFEIESVKYFYHIWF